MDGALLAARLLLGLVFIVAGLAKLADWSGSQDAVAAFGVPRTLAAPIGILLPIAEIVIAVLLVPTATAWGASIAAVVLLALFVAGISINLARGRKPDCHCFGQLHSEPVGWSTLGRNTVLGLIGLFIVVAGHPNAGTSAVGWLHDLRAAEVVGLVVALVLAALVLGMLSFLFNLLQQNGRLLTRIESLEERVNGLSAGQPPAPAATAASPQQPAYGLPIGTPAPAFSLSGLFGEIMTLDALKAQGKPVLLMFTDPGCGPCGELLPDVARWQKENDGDVTLALISRGDPSANREKFDPLGIRNVLLQENDEIGQAYKSPGTPSIVLVQPDGTIGSVTSAGPPAIRSMVTGILGTATPPLDLLDQMPTVAAAPNGGNGSGPTTADTLKVGDMVPSIKLKDINSKSYDLAGLRGRKHLFLFWNPGCGFCQQMLSDLKDWERAKGPEAPDLVVIAAGSVEANRAQAISSPVLSDPTFQVAQRFGAGGTPMGVLVDENGTIVSDVAAGAPGVWSLVGGGPAGAEAAAAPSSPAGRAVGEPAPPIKLADLEGKTVNLSDYRGSDVLVLFWNPGCGFCQQMLPDLKTWEAKRPKRAPKLLIVSTGSVEDNKALGFKSTVVLDQNFQVGPQFGALGTPMGVLIDAEGRIASDVGAGAPGVWPLLGGSPNPAAAGS